MKKTKLITYCASGFLAALLSACVAPHTYYDAGLGEDGYYGTIPSLPGYTPQVWNTNPVVAIGAGLGLAAIYLNVPAYQRLNWGVYCSIYNACYRPVYFVQSAWYRTVFAPAYLRRYGKPGPAFRPMGQPGGMGPRPPANGQKPPANGAKPPARPGSNSTATAQVKPGSIPGIRPMVQRPGSTPMAGRPNVRPGSGVATTATRPTTSANRPGATARPSAGARPAGAARPATGAARPSGARPSAPPPRGGASSPITPLGGARAR